MTSWSWVAPPGVDPKVVQNDFEATVRLCVNPRVARGSERC